LLYWGNSYIIREVKQNKRTEIRMEWSNVTRKLSELKPWERNPRLIKEDQAKRLEESYDSFGQVETIAIGPDSEVYNGHQRLSVLMAKHGGEYEVACRQSDQALTEKQREKLTAYLHRGTTGDWNWDMLANEWDLDDLLEWGFDESELIGWEKDTPEAPEEEEEEPSRNREITCPNCGHVFRE